MEFKISDEKKEKIKILVIPAGCVLVFYLFFKYIFPLIWPLAAAAALAILLYPIVRFLHKKFRINKMIGTIFILLLLTVLLGIISAIIVEKLITQLTLFVDNFSYYQDSANHIVEDVCQYVEQMFGMEDGCVLDFINVEINKFITEMKNKVMQFLIGTSIPAVRSVIDVMIAAAFVVVVFFLIMKDMEKIKRNVKNSTFGTELTFFFRRSIVVFKAYIKAQFIIMIIVAALSVLGLTFAGNRYAWLIGISVGVLDALPLFGAGVILVPITLLALMNGNLIRAAIVFTTFIACYFAREFLEPKLMGDKMGVNPIMTLVGIYVGYKLFGFWGMFAGALTVIFLMDVVKMVKGK